MKTFSFLSHTADIRMKLQADSLKELFLAGLEGVTHLLKKNIHIKDNNQKYTIHLKSIDKTALLVDFLSEYLSICQYRRSVFTKAYIKKITEKEIIADLYMAPIDLFDEDIKAITYSEARIIKNIEGQLETTIVFDI